MVLMWAALCFATAQVHHCAAACLCSGHTTSVGRVRDTGRIQLKKEPSFHMKGTDKTGHWQAELKDLAALRLQPPAVISGVCDHVRKKGSWGASCFQTPTMLPEPDHAWRTLHLPNPATLPKPNNGFRTQSRCQNPTVLQSPIMPPKPNGAAGTNHASRCPQCLQPPMMPPQPNHASRPQPCLQNPTMLPEPNSAFRNLNASRHARDRC